MKLLLFVIVIIVYFNSFYLKCFFVFCFLFNLKNVSFIELLQLKLKLLVKTMFHFN